MKLDTAPARYAVMVGVALGCAALASIAGKAAADGMSLPLLCSTGPSGQRFNLDVTIPRSAEAGSVYEIRIDGSSSGKISSFGLNFIHDMTVQYVLPSGSAYVEGSALLVAGTGTPNVRADAHVSVRGGIVTMVLPGSVTSGSSYTPPSVSVKLRATGSPGDAAVVGFNRYELKANAVLVGDVAVSCDPKPKPYPIGTTRITAPAAPRD
jgi:hypothetical protein